MTNSTPIRSGQATIRDGYGYTQWDNGVQTFRRSDGTVTGEITTVEGDKVWLKLSDGTHASTDRQGIQQ